MSEHTYRLNPITGEIVPVDDAPMGTVVDDDGNELWTQPAAHPDEKMNVIFDYDL